MLRRMAGQFPVLPRLQTLLYFLFNNFCPKHTTEAADILKPSERYSFKESSHGKSFDSLSPNDRQTGPQKVATSPWMGQNENIRFKGFVHFRTGSFRLCLFSFQFQVCTTCFGHYWDCLTITFPIKFFPWLQKQKASKENSSVLSHPTLEFSCAWLNQKFGLWVSHVIFVFSPFKTSN